MSSAHKLEPQDSLLPIFRKAEISPNNNNVNTSVSTRRLSNPLDTTSGLKQQCPPYLHSETAKMDLLDSVEDVSFHNIVHSNNNNNSVQASVSFNHEAGSSLSATAILKTSPAMHHIAIPDMSLTDLSVLRRRADQRLVEGQGNNDNALMSGQEPGRCGRRETAISSSATSVVPSLNTNASRSLRSTSARCAQKRRNPSPNNRKGRGSYVCTKPKRTYRR